MKTIILILYAALNDQFEVAIKDFQMHDHYCRSYFWYQNLIHHIHDKSSQ
jgi:hypothetical protein